MRGVRARLTVTLVALVATTGAVLGIGSYLFVDARMHEQALTEATKEAQFDLSVSGPRAWQSSPTQASLAAFTSEIARPDVGLIVDYGAAEPYVSTSSLFGAVDALSTTMRSLVAAGQLAYEWTRIANEPVLVVGGRMPPTGPTIYFVHDARAIDSTLDLLRLTLGAGALVLVVVAALVARIVSRGVLAPVEAASRAADRIADGDLAARVPVSGRDEFGAWATRFNAMAESLEHNVGRLRDAQAQNRRFVADVSHELRTPLAALVAEASILREHLDALPPDSRRAGELLVADVGRLRVLVDDLMEVSRFDADAETPATAAVDVGSLIHSIVANRLPDARVTLPPGPLVFETDARRIERILGNVLENAREHAPGAPVAVAVSADDRSLSIAVEDQGAGVDAAVLERIFERFYKADPSRHGGSSGLGLAIAAEHVALLGGAIRATNRAGGGLRIEIVLPVTESLQDRDVAAIDERDRGAPSRSIEEPFA
jgi:two-component system sensor histidine kinase MtrB